MKLVDLLDCGGCLKNTQDPLSYGPEWWHSEQEEGVSVAKNLPVCRTRC